MGTCRSYGKRRTVSFCSKTGQGEKMTLTLSEIFTVLMDENPDSISTSSPEELGGDRCSIVIPHDEMRYELSMEDIGGGVG